MVQKFVIMAAVLSCLLSAIQQCCAQSRSATLRTKFNAAFARDFDLIKDELKTRAVERGGGTYWLALVKPKRTGFFYLQYRYLEKYPLDIREHELRFSVGPKGCSRGTPSSGVYTRFCLGDTIILPVLVNNYSGHEFKLTKAEYTDEKDDRPAPQIDPHSLDETAIENPAAAVMKYLGRRVRKMYHRIPGYTMNLQATFQAEQLGKMNLLVTADQPADALGNTYGGVPIIVVARETPVTLIAGHEEVRGYTKGHDGREFLFSTSSNGYMTNVFVIQPGDRLEVIYFSVVRRDDFVKGRFGETGPDPGQDLKPKITVRPFAPDVRYDFTEWIVDYLPR